MRKPLTFLLACTLAALAPQASAFGPESHMAIGSVADALLAGTNAGKQARKLLGSNLRTASVWADCAKGVNEKTGKYVVNPKFKECAIYESLPSQAAMEAFVKRNLTNCSSPYTTEVCHKQYHYTDVAVQRDAYAKGKMGTTDQDIVSAINAAIAVLQGQTSPAPFNIQGKKEALRLLSHYMGDVHQPLHVAAVYLDTSGRVIDPDAGAFDPATETRGGNDLLIGNVKLHAMWDSVTGSVIDNPPSADTLNMARQVTVTDAPLNQWSRQWATETLLIGKQAFENISYSPVSGKTHQIVLPGDYASAKNKVQRFQVIKAGARLAQVLQAIWP